MIRKQIVAIDNDVMLDQSEKTKRKQNLYLVHDLNNISLASTPPTPSSLASAVSPLTRPFYPAMDTIESVVGELLHLIARHCKMLTNNFCLGCQS